MNISLQATDNITELLIRIIEFTQTRQKLLVHNLNNLHRYGFVPKDLPVVEFSELLNCAIDEHIRNRRLIMQDTENIKFGLSGSFETEPIVDRYAKELLRQNRDEYIEFQVTKLLENSLNQRIAAQLLKQGTMDGYTV